MANNFKLTGSNYVAKAPSGHSSNNGTTKDTPRAVPGETNHTVIGTGHYVFDGTIGTTGAGDNTEALMIGDGIVKLERLNEIGTNTINANAVIADIHLVRFFFSNISSGTRSVSRCILERCTGGGGSTSDVRIRHFVACIIIDSGSLSFPFPGGGAFRNRLINCISINSISHCRFMVRDSYFDNACVLNLTTLLSAGNIDDFRRNNIEGVILIDGTLFTDSLPHYYAIQDVLTGTPQDNGYDAGVEWLSQSQLTTDGYTGTLSGIDTAVATMINRDPKFNNPSLRDYSLQADSPHIGRGLDGTNIGPGNLGVAISILNTDDGIGTEVNPTAEIDTTVPLGYQLHTEETEGYIDYIFKMADSAVVLGIIRPLAELSFNSDEEGGTVGNNNVPDSEPLSIEYPRKLTTTSAAGDAVTLIVSGNDAVVGEWVRVEGEDREITDVTGDDITVASAFRANVGSGVTFQIGTESQLGALRPNRLTYLLRTSTGSSKPVVDADWDNSIDPIYEAEGLFLTQEWFKQPQYIIDNLDDNKIYGSGDSDAPTDITPNDIEAIWANVRVYLRNDYES